MNPDWSYLAIPLAFAWGGLSACYLGWLLLVKPWWYSEANQREMLARQMARSIAYGVLHWTFGYSHVKGSGQERQLQLVRFLTPLGKRVTIASDETGNDHPGSYLQVWDWSTFRLQPVPIGSVYLELDLCHLPYDHSVDWLIAHKDDVEIHGELHLFHDWGVKRVKLMHYWLRDRDQRRVIFRLVWREREKSPDIPQHLDYGEMMTAWAQHEHERRKYNRLEVYERELLAKRLLDYGIRNFDGTFPLKKLQAAFAREISHRQIEALGQQLEAEGVLIRVWGPNPRRIDLERAKELLPPARPEPEPEPA